MVVRPVKCILYFYQNMSSPEKESHSFIKGPQDQWDGTFQMMDWWDSKKIAAAKVMVVGAGALGNEVLKNLALLNVGHIFIVDFDQIEYGNLSRSILFREKDCLQQKAKVAAKQLKQINPNVKVQFLDGDIAIDVGLGVFRRMDVVIGCLDNRVARLFINRHCYKVQKTWVDGAIENLAGQLEVFKPGISCYECQLTSAEWQIIHFRLGCADIARRNANFGSIPTTPISSSIIGALQVQEALRVIYGQEKDSLLGKSFRYYGKTNDVLFTKTPSLRKEECDSHNSYDPIIEISELSCSQSVKELLSWLQKHFDDPTAKVLLDEEIVLKIVTNDDQEYDVAILKYHLSDELATQYKKAAEDTLYFKERVMILDDTFPYPDLSLKKLGIPPLQILKVEAKADIHFVELTGDEDFLDFK